MKRLATIAFLALPCGAFAQLPVAELRSIDPPVVASGRSTEITVLGSNLEELTSLHFSDDRIEAEPIDGSKFRVTVPADLAPGIVEVRAAGYFGLSTSRPLAIVRSDRKIIEENRDPETPTPLPVEALAHGTTDANQTDWFSFPAKKGDRLLIHCYAERIDSLADATLTLADELGRDRDTIGRDPMLDFTAPADGEYLVGVHDFLYEGGTSYPYLLEVTRRPWIDAVFPPAMQKGSTTELTLLGRNLPGGSQGEGIEIDGRPIETVSVRVTAPEKPDAPVFGSVRPSRGILPTFGFRLETSNKFDIGLTDLPVTVVKEDEETPPLNPPVEVAACFDTDGDSDEFKFLAAAGKTYWIEVIGDRIASRVDPFLEIAGGKTADDSEGGGGVTFDDASRDAAVAFTPKEAGEQSVTVVNQFASGGPDHIYRLAIREAVPDFTLIGILERPYLDQRQAYPATPHLRRGGTFPVRVLVDRRDGFDGPIKIAAEGLPDGVTCPPLTISGKESAAHLVFNASPDATPWAGTVSVFGESGIGRRPLRAATLVSGTTDYNVARLRSRLALEFPLSVTEYEEAPVSLEVGNGGKFSVTMGEKLEIPVKITARNGLKGNLALTPVGLRGLSKPPTLTLSEKNDEGKLTLDFTEKKGVFAPEVGTWNFILKATGTTRFRLNPQAAERAAAEVKRLEAASGTDPKELDEARKHAKTAADRAKEKDVTFAAWTLPIEVEVKPAPEKKSP